MQTTHLHNAPRKALSNFSGETPSTLPTPLRQPRAHGGRSRHTGKDVTDVLILGAGASGLMCAREAAGRGLKVVVLGGGTAEASKPEPFSSGSMT